MSRLKGKPFEILAVSLDDAREFLVQIVEQKSIPGIHTWDEQGRDNPIAEMYNAFSLPSWFLLDEKGVIRARDPFGDKLIPAVESIFAKQRHPDGTK